MLRSWPWIEDTRLCGKREPISLSTLRNWKRTNRRLHCWHLERLIRCDPRLAQQILDSLQPMNTKEKEYLGDGVYVDICSDFPGGVVLTTENGIEPTNTIYLEPRVIKALIGWLGRQELLPLKTALGEALKPEL